MKSLKIKLPTFFFTEFRNGCARKNVLVAVPFNVYDEVGRNNVKMDLPAVHIIDGVRFVSDVVR